MNIHDFFSRAPVVREEDMHLCQIVAVGGQRQAVPFHARILHIREDSAQIEYHHGGLLFKQGECYNDYYGYLTSVDNAIEGAIERCRVLKITEQSSLVCSVTLTIVDKAVIRPEPVVVEYQRTKYTRVNDGWMRYVPDQIEAWLHETDHEKRYEIGQPLMLHRDTEVFKAQIWTSTFPDRFPDVKAWIKEQGY